VLVDDSAGRALSEEQNCAVLDIVDTPIADAAHDATYPTGAVRGAPACVDASIATDHTGEMPIA
jgi:hypothetical protein